jgi:hypothetical protein
MLYSLRDHIGLVRDTLNKQAGDAGNGSLLRWRRPEAATDNLRRLRVVEFAFTSGGRFIGRPAMEMQLPLFLTTARPAS